MLLPTTERLPEIAAIDTLSPPHAASALLDGQSDAIAAVRRAAHDIDRGAEAMATAIRSGNALIYAAAGSSGLMALADACELSGTFGIPADAIQIHMAGGVPTNAKMPGDTEDDTETAHRATDRVAKGDVIIVASASGTTPFALAVAKNAKAKGGTIIAIANNPATPLLKHSDVSICLETPPEVIAGSTRLGAGTALKAALNLMSSMMGVKLGHVYQGMMVNVTADNAKLVKRAAGIVSHIADVSESEAKDALSRSRGNAKAAILIANGCTATRAANLLKTNHGHLGPCLQTLMPNN